MAAVELLEVSRTIRSAMGESAGQFKQAATSSNANLNKIVKDIATTFASQRKDITELHNTISEGQYSAEQTNEKIDGLTRVFQESLSIQSNMLGEMRSISKNIKILNDNTESMNRNLNNSLIGTGTGSILSSLNTGFSNVAVALGGAALATALNPGDNKDGDSGGVTVGSAKGQEGYKQIYDAAKKAGDKFPEVTASQWALESSWGKSESGKNNVFGQKATASEPGTMRWTHENVNGQSVRTLAKFKDYDSIDEAVAEHVKKWSSKYAGASSAGEAVQTLKSHGYATDPDYVSKIMSIARGQANVVGSGAATGGTTPSAETTPAASTPNVAQQISPDTSPRVDPIGKEGGHGPVSGAMHSHGGEGKLSGVNKAILDKFNQIQSSAGTPLNVTSGFRDPAENARVGGAKNSAHTRGNAVDVTFGGGIPETLKLIEAASKAGVGGIGVYRPGVLHFDTEAKRAWGPSYGHESVPDWAREAINKHLGGGTGGKTPDAEPTAATPSTTSQMQQMQMAAAGGGGLGVQQGGPAATAVEQPSIAQAMSPAASAGISPMQMMGMMSMMGGSIPGMGAISGIMSSVIPMIGSALNQLESTPINFAELTPQPTVSTQNIQRVKEAAIENQTTQETYQSQMIQQPNTPDISSQNPTLSQGDSSGYAYNLLGDIGWPDWAAMIGGNHWEEMKHYKKNMWG